MITPGQRMPIVIATKPVDFRRGYDGLAATVQNELGLAERVHRSPIRNCLSVQRNGGRIEAGVLARLPAGRPMFRRRGARAYPALPEKNIRTCP